MEESADAVLTEKQDPGILLVTFNRPDSLNAFSSDMANAFTDALRLADTDDSIRVVVVTGAGRAFCAGADFSQGADAFDAPRDEQFSSDPLDAFHPWDCRKPVIAAINGHAVGIGLTMTLQCDIRIVATDAKLGIVQNRRGVLPDAHAHWKLWPPRWPVTSTTSPIKCSPGTDLDCISFDDSISVDTPPSVTSAVL